MPALSEEHRGENAGPDTVAKWRQQPTDHRLCYRGPNMSLA